MWYSPGMKSLQAQFSFCQLLMLCTAFASVKTHGMITSPVLIRICHLVMLLLWKNKPSWQLKRLWFPFAHLDFLYPLTATTTDMMHLETGHVENYNKKSNLSIYSTCCSVPIKRASEILPGQVCHPAYLPSWRLGGKKNNMDPWYLQCLQRTGLKCYPVVVGKWTHYITSSWIHTVSIHEAM